MSDPSSLPRGDERVLLVDDDDQVRRALSLLLKNLGYDTLLACEGEEALGVIEKTEIDLMISDVVMPGMDGIQLATKVREDHPDLPILLISGYADGTVTGVRNTRFLRKPFSMSDLAREIRSTIDEFGLSDRTQPIGSS